MIAVVILPVLKHSSTIFQVFFFLLIQCQILTTVYSQTPTSFPTVQPVGQEYNPPPNVNEVVRIYPGESFTLKERFFLGLIIVPAIIATIGLFLLLTYQLALCCRCCFTWCCPNRCQNCYIRHQEYIQGDFNTRMKYHRFAIISFFICMFITFIFTCMMVLPFHNLSSGIDNTSASLYTIENIFNIIINDGNAISTNIGIIDEYVLNEPCHEAFQHYNISDKLDHLCNSMQDGIELIIHKVGTIPQQLSHSQDVINHTVQPIIQSIFWWYMGIVLIILFLYLILFYCCKNKKLLTIMIILTEMVVIVLSLIYVIEMYVVHLTGAFCYPNPSDNVLKEIAVNSSVYNTVEYYTTCDGNNPFAQNYARVKLSLVLFNNTFTQYSTQTADYLMAANKSAECVTSISNEVDDTFVLVDSILSQFACEPLNTAWNLAVNEGVCTDFFNGFYQLWIIHIITCWILFFMLVSAFMFYELFDPTLRHVQNTPHEGENNGGLSRGNNPSDAHPGELVVVPTKKGETPYNDIQEAHVVEVEANEYVRAINESDNR